MLLQYLLVAAAAVAAGVAGEAVAAAEAVFAAEVVAAAMPSPQLATLPGSAATKVNLFSTAWTLFYVLNFCPQ